MPHASSPIRLLPITCIALLSACGGVADALKGDRGDDGGLLDDCDEATVYDDFDLDTFGNGATGRLGCEGDAGTVLNGDDCDDTDPRIFPGLPELCIDGLDQDCDGVPDDGCHMDWCGAITADTVWESRFIHDVTCDVEVGGDAEPTLVVEDGAQVFVSEDVRLLVGARPGRLLVEGGELGIFFDPAEEDTVWGGVQISSADQGSVLAGAFLRHANIGLQVVAASPTLTDMTIEDSSRQGVLATGGASPVITGTTISGSGGVGLQLDTDSCIEGQGTFTDNVIVGGAAEPVHIPPRCYQGLDASSSYTGNALDEVRLIGNTGTADYFVEGDHDWQDLGVVVVLANGHFLSGGRELTLRDGLRIEVAPSTGEGLGAWEILTADGHTDGIHIQGGVLWIDTGTVRGVTFEQTYRVHANDAVLEDVLFLDAWTIYDGQHALTTAGSLTRVTVDGCRHNGVLLEEGTSHVEDLTVTGCSDYPVEARPTAAWTLGPDATLTGNGIDRVRVAEVNYARDMIVDESTTWRGLEVPYEMGDDLYVEGDSAPVLTLQEGVEIFIRLGGIRVGDRNYGDLVIDGGASGVHIGPPDEYSTSHWEGIYLHSVDTAVTSIDGAVLSRPWLGIEARVAGVPIRNTTIHQAGEHGFFGYAPVLQDSEITDSAEYGIYVGWGGDVSGITGNVVSGNGEVGWLLPDQVGPLIANNTLTGNVADHIQVRNGTVYTDQTWTSDFSYTVSSSSRELIIASGATLTIEPGTTLAMYGRLDAEDGALNAVGTTAAPIVFTSAHAAPAAGDWNGVLLGDDSVLEHATVEYAGDVGAATIGAAVLLYGAATIRDTTVRDSASWCIGRTRDADDAVIEDVTYSDCADGDLY
jgi:parallel beta-helix repeat protein